MVRSGFRLPVLVDRPRTREECEDGPRPCPWVGCRHHLYLEVNELSGKIRINNTAPRKGQLYLPWPSEAFGSIPPLQPEDMLYSCSLDLADEGAGTLEEVGALMGVTRARVQQIEEQGLGRARRMGSH